jgi:hypothetical protein
VEKGIITKEKFLEMEEEMDKNKNDYEAAPDAELIRYVQHYPPDGEKYQKALAELTSRQEQRIKENDRIQRQILTLTSHLVRLTWVIAALTFVLAVLTGAMVVKMFC